MKIDNMIVPTVSVITPTYNDTKYVRAAIDSVLAQSFRDFEILVSDDCSTDYTRDIVTAYQDPRVKLLTADQNRGAGAARNAGQRAASGRFIAFLDSDDVWEPTKLEKQLAHMNLYGVEICATNFTIMDESGAVISKNPGLPRLVNRGSLLKYCSIQTSSLIYDRKALGTVEFPSIARRQDYAMFLKLLGADRVAHVLEERLFSYRVRKGSVSAKKMGNIPFQWTVYRDIEKLGTLASLYYMANWFVRSGTVNIKRRIGALGTQ